MKKLLALLTLMVAFFGFTAGAFSAVGDPVCVTCKGSLRNIPCPTASGQATASCKSFDYDDATGGLSNVAIGTTGYCTILGTAENYRAIFSICNCTNAATFIPGLKVAIKMTILVNAVAGERGAYWSQRVGEFPATIKFMDSPTAAGACAIAVANQTKSFGPATIYYLSDGTTVSVPDVTGGCAVAASGRTTILTNGVGIGYNIVATDGPYWWIDIPPIRVDSTVVASGAIITVRIELFDATAVLPICPSCITPLCACDIQVAQMCCSTATSTTLSFPYFTSLTTGSYWNGISISNPTTAAGSCVLTARAKNGTVGTSTVAVPATSMFVDFLENLTWAGTGLGGSPVYITAVCNYGGAFGFAMMANGTHDSMGYKVP